MCTKPHRLRKTKENMAEPFFTCKSYSNTKSVSCSTEVQDGKQAHKDNKGMA